MTGALEALTICAGMLGGLALLIAIGACVQAAIEKLLGD